MNNRLQEQHPTTEGHLGSLAAISLQLIAQVLGRRLEARRVEMLKTEQQLFVQGSQQQQPQQLRQCLFCNRPAAGQGQLCSQ